MAPVAFNVGRNKSHVDDLRLVVGKFSDLIELLTGTTNCSSKDGPYVAGPFIDNRRGKTNVMPRAWVALDLDRISDAIEMASIIEAAEEWRGVGYTTHSHNPAGGVFKLRLVFAVDREIEPSEYARVCSGLAAELGRLAAVRVVRDTACDKIEQPLFTARAGASTWKFGGCPVAVDAVIAAVQPEQNTKSVIQDGKTHGDWLAQLLDGENVHGNAVRLVGHMVATGMSDKTIRATMRALAIGVSQARGPDRANELMGAELDRMIKGARIKGFAPPPIPEIESHDEQTAVCQHDDSSEPPELQPNRVSIAPMDSDIGLSALFAKRNRGQLRWSPGLDWMANAGTHWVRDEDLTRYSKAKAMCAQMSRAQNLPDSSRRKVASASTVSAVLTLARDERGIATPADAWDREPMVLNTPGGAYDLETGKRLIGNGDLFTQIIAVAPDPTMEIPTWLRFILDIFARDLDMVEFIQRLFGYCLTGDRREQRLPFFYGTGANGKSVLVDELRATMGSYALNLPSEALMRQQHQAHPTELAQLRGKRLAISSELEDGAYWAESRIKSLTGDATLRARFMRQDFFEFRQTQKHIVVGNFKPRLKGDDPAIARRLVLVPFTEKFTGLRCDPQLPVKLAAERPGIAAWMIEGARKWARVGLRIPASVREASAEYLNANDDISLWIEECCDTGPMLRGAATALYKSYAEWKEAAGERPQSMTAWGERMGQRFAKARTSVVRGYNGVALRPMQANTMGASQGYGNQRE